ncbi:hypothetical protein DM01DRAFT_1409971 [Hesseltinella vesiculosa]|uniref:DUF8032 domain-containing protein n=1 Tax=Hesseltinella vesiculosa TaxID=101127 RepID=A0A1X2G995_9FUNG|nr:hypothetical protein DM01DRAFT_1409971 [Hesseltinella vesiculosa]
MSDTYNTVTVPMKLETVDWDYFNSGMTLTDLQVDQTPSSLAMPPAGNDDFLSWQAADLPWSSFLDTLATEGSIPFTDACTLQPPPASLSPSPLKPADFQQMALTSASSVSSTGPSLPPTPPSASPTAFYEMNLLSNPIMTSTVPTPPTPVTMAPAMIHPLEPTEPMAQPTKTPKQRRHSHHASHASHSDHHPVRRRLSSHPSVASVVSLTAHAPVHKIVEGIEHLSFLYSHDRLVKEYTVRIDVDAINLDLVPTNFRDANTIYPRANVPREHYDGNRWEYESTCNSLGWKLCWLNKEQLCGRRGLIQRAVDAYRNHHTDMRSRRVTRQEKVANGTLRKRKSKRYSVA